jgi:uncharacterized membrane protein YkgB
MSGFQKPAVTVLSSGVIFVVIVKFTVSFIFFHPKPWVCIIGILEIYDVYVLVFEEFQHVLVPDKLAFLTVFFLLVTTSARFSPLSSASTDSGMKTTSKSLNRSLLLEYLA